jgi:hypothetical protein
MQIGDYITLQEDVQAKSAISGKPIKAKKGDEAVILEQVNEENMKVKFINGKMKGKYMVLSGRLESGIDIESLSIIITEDIDPKIPLKPQIEDWLNDLL